MAAAPVRLEEPISADLCCCICLVACNRARVHASGETAKEDCPQHHAGGQELLPFRAQEPTPVQTQPAATPVPVLRHVMVQSLPSAPIPAAPALIPTAPGSGDGAVKGLGHHHCDQEQEVQGRLSAPIPTSSDRASKDNQDHKIFEPKNIPETLLEQVMVKPLQPAPIQGSEVAGNLESDVESEEQHEDPSQLRTFANAVGLAVSEEGEIFVADSYEIQVFTMQGKFVRQFPTVVPYGEEMWPNNVAMDGEGNLWVVGHTDSDTAEFAVQYDKQGKVLRKFDLQHTKGGIGVAVDTRRNHILITQTTVVNYNCHGKVLVFRPDGTLVRTMGQQQGMKRPQYITVDVEGNILVSDYENHCVFVYNCGGQFLYKFGGRGSGKGRLINPEGICTDRAGNIIVADYGNSRVEMFDKTGRFLKHITTDLELSGAVAMATDGQLVVMYTMDCHFTNEDEAFCVFSPELDKVTAHSVPATLVAGQNQNESQSLPGRITFGGKGRRQGKLENPVGVAVSKEGEIFVAETHRIQVFTLQGTFVRQFPPAVVSGEEEMNTYYVAMDGEGNLWMVGGTEFAVFAVQYDKQGSLLRKFRPQKTEWMTGVAVDTIRNHILITTTTGGVEVYRPDGTLVTIMGKQQGMLEPQCITVDGQGRILVTDSDGKNCYIYVFNGNGEFLFKFGDGETAQSLEEDEDQDDDDECQKDKRQEDKEGQLHDPKGICTDSSGNIIVADWVYQHGHVEVWDKTGRFLYRIFEDLESSPEAVAMAPQGQLVVTDGNNKVTVFEKELVAQSDRVTFGRKGRQPGQFKYPLGVAVSNEGEIFVADSDNRRIQVFTLEGTLVKQFPAVVPTADYPMEPLDLAMDMEENLWVVSMWDVAVQYDKQGRVLNEINIGGTDFNRGVAVDTRSNHILVTQTMCASNRTYGSVQVFRPDNTFVRTMGKEEMCTPHYIVVNGEGNILVSDWEGDCIYVYNEIGQFLFKFGGEGSGKGQLEGPRGICTDTAGNIIVAEDGYYRVKVFDRKGRFLKHIPSYIMGPCAVAMATQGQLVVTYLWRHKVIVFQNY